MHSYNDSVMCCRKFGETYEQKTGQEYHKDNQRIYTILNRFGNEDQAIQIADNRLRGYLQDGIKNPSEMCPGTTVQRLVDEIKEKVKNTITNL